MKDIGKRNLVIGRLNQDLDCVDVRDPQDPNQISNSKKLIDMYKILCKHQEENQLDPAVVQESFELLGTDPSEIIKLNLAFSIVASDKFQRETSYTKE